MRVRVRLPIAVLTLSAMLSASAPAAHAEEVIADVTIRSVRLTEQLVLRVEATYVCSAGYSVDARSARAFAGQQTAVYPSSHSKTIDGITVCDGTRQEVLVRFVKPRHPRGDAHWEFGALTQITLSFVASRQDPFATVNPTDRHMVTTGLEPSDHADVAADITVEGVRINARGVIHVRATYICPSGFAVEPALPPHLFLRQETEGRPMRQKRFDGVECDGTRHALDLRSARPGQPEGARWEHGALTHVSLTFQADRESPYLFVLASDAQSTLI